MQLKDVRSQPFGYFIRRKNGPAPNTGMISSHFGQGLNINANRQCWGSGERWQRPFWVLGFHFLWVPLFCLCRGGATGRARGPFAALIPTSPSHPCSRDLRASKASTPCLWQCPEVQSSPFPFFQSNFPKRF